VLLLRMLLWYVLHRRLLLLLLLKGWLCLNLHLITLSPWHLQHGLLRSTPPQT
jgi:hypothetical protein